MPSSCPSLPLDYPCPPFPDPMMAALQEYDPVFLPPLSPYMMQRRFSLLFCPLSSPLFFFLFAPTGRSLPRVLQSPFNPILNRRLISGFLCFCPQWELPLSCSTFPPHGPPSRTWFSPPPCVFDGPVTPFLATTSSPLGPPLSPFSEPISLSVLLLFFYFLLPSVIFDFTRESPSLFARI